MADKQFILNEDTSRLLEETIRKVQTLKGDGVKNTSQGITISWPPKKPKDRPGDSNNLFPVLVEKDGGSDGSASAAATWTYTIRDIGGTTTIATAKGQTRPRPYGMMTYQSGSNGYGIAFRSGTNTLLWDAGEVPTIVSCE